MYRKRCLLGIALAAIGAFLVGFGVALQAVQMGYVSGYTYETHR